jgi:hypothetical protein
MIETQKGCEGGFALLITGLARYSDTFEQGYSPMKLSEHPIGVKASLGPLVAWHGRGEPIGATPFEPS